VYERSLRNPRELTSVPSEEKLDSVIDKLTTELTKLDAAIARNRTLPAAQHVRELIQEAVSLAREIRGGGEDPRKRARLSELRDLLNV